MKIHKQAPPVQRSSNRLAGAALPGNVRPSFIDPLSILRTVGQVAVPVGQAVLGGLSKLL